MSHAKVLEVTARLFVDPRFRRRLLEDARGALEGWELTAVEREALGRFDRQAVERVGRMTDCHRLTRVLEQVPWADASRRPGLGAVLERFLEEVPAQLLNREEAIACCLFLEALPPGHPPYLRELARCERLRVMLAWGMVPGGATVLRERLEYPIHLLREALAAPGWPRVEPSPACLEFRKVPGLPAVLVQPHAEGLSSP